MTTMTGYLRVEAEEWQRWVTDNDAVILDVREPQEWELGTLPGSLLISMGEIMDRIDEIPDDRAVLCVCRSGARSAQVASYLAMMGHRQIANMEGGLKTLGMQD